jgi:hypothetical protein
MNPILAASTAPRERSTTVFCIPACVRYLTRGDPLKGRRGNRDAIKNQLSAPRFPS